MRNEAHNHWKATAAGRRARIIGAKPVPAAPVEHPRQRTLAALARSTNRRPELSSLLAEAATTARRWTP